MTCRWGVMETAGLLGTSSAVDSQAWQEVMQHRMTPSTTRPPSILETGATCQSFAILYIHAWNVFCMAHASCPRMCQQVCSC